MSTLAEKVQRDLIQAMGACGGINQVRGYHRIENDALKEVDQSLGAEDPHKLIQTEIENHEEDREPG